jgi:hypothetical protein
MFMGVFVFMCVFLCVCINAGMPDCPSSDQSSTGMKKLTMPGMVRYQTKLRQSGIFWVQYQTEIIDAGILMPPLVSEVTDWYNAISRLLISKLCEEKN